MRAAGLAARLSESARLPNMECHSDEHQALRQLETESLDRRLEALREHNRQLETESLDRRLEALREHNRQVKAELQSAMGKMRV